MRPFALCFTGISGSGKTTLANAVAERLRADGVPIQVLDGDVLRGELGNLFGFTREEREKQSRVIRVVAKYLLGQDISVMLAIVTPYEELRRSLRAYFGESYLEVWVKCPYEECARRDVKGYYKRARENRMENLSGANDVFEEPGSPDLVVETDLYSREVCAEKILTLIRERGFFGER